MVSFVGTDGFSVGNRWFPSWEPMETDGAPNGIHVGNGWTPYWGIFEVLWGIVWRLRPREDKLFLEVVEMYAVCVAPRGKQLAYLLLILRREQSITSHILIVVALA